MDTNVSARSPEYMGFSATGADDPPSSSRGANFDALDFRTITTATRARRATRPATTPANAPTDKPKTDDSDDCEKPKEGNSRRVVRWVEMRVVE